MAREPGTRSDSSSPIYFWRWSGVGGLEGWYRSGYERAIRGGVAFAERPGEDGEGRRWARLANAKMRGEGEESAAGWLRPCGVAGSSTAAGVDALWRWRVSAWETSFEMYAKPKWLVI